MKWKKIKTLKDLPCPADDVLFTDGEWIYVGWIESHSENEPPSFYNNLRTGSHWPENITHWMSLPDLPKNPGNEKIHFGPSPDDT